MRRALTIGSAALLGLLLATPALAAGPQGASVGKRGKSAAPAIRIGRKATVDGPTITLGEVARISGFTADAKERLAGIDLGPSPTVGTGRLLPRAYLKTALANGGVGPGVKLKLPSRLEVQRRARTLRGSALASRVRDAVRERMPHAPEDVQGIEVQSLPDLKVPKSARIAVILPDDADYRGRTQAELRITDRGELVRSQRVMVQIDAMGTVFGLPGAARRGQSITPAELVEIRLPESEIPRDAIRDRAEVERARLRRDVKGNEPLRASALELPPLVQRGDLVTMIAVRGAVRLTARGEALSQGRRGDTIKIRNLASKKVVGGRVEGAQTVVMEY